MTDSSPKRNPAFAEWMETVAGGRSNRVLDRLCGVSHTQIGDMRWGRVPTYRTLERFMAGMRLDEETRAAGFRLAGYTPPRDRMGEPDAPAYDLYRTLWREMVERLRAAGVTQLPLGSIGFGGNPPQTEEEMRREIAAIEADALDRLRR